MTAVARGFVILAYGLFSIAAQTLIFREFITSFEKSKLFDSSPAAVAN